MRPIRGVPSNGEQRYVPHFGIAVAEMRGKASVALFAGALAASGFPVSVADLKGVETGRLLPDRDEVLPFIDAVAQNSATWPENARAHLSYCLVASILESRLGTSMAAESWPTPQAGHIYTREEYDSARASLRASPASTNSVIDEQE